MLLDELIEQLQEMRVTGKEEVQIWEPKDGDYYEVNTVTTEDGCICINMGDNCS